VFIHYFLRDIEARFLRRKHTIATDWFNDGIPQQWLTIIPIYLGSIILYTSNIDQNQNKNKIQFKNNWYAYKLAPKAGIIGTENSYHHTRHYNKPVFFHCSFEKRTLHLNLGHKKPLQPRQEWETVLRKMGGRKESLHKEVVKGPELCSRNTCWNFLTTFSSIGTYIN